MSNPKPITIEEFRKLSQGGIYIIALTDPRGYTYVSRMRFESWGCSDNMIERGQVFSIKEKLLAYIKQRGWKEKDGVAK